MTITVKVGEAETHFSELIAKVEAGEEIVIARGDRPVARLVPLPDEHRIAVRHAIEDIRAIRSRSAQVTSEELIAWKHEGHGR